MIDSHCHIQFPAYDADRDEVIARAMQAGVNMLAVGTQAATSRAAILLSEKYPAHIWATAGFHPNHIAAQMNAAKDKLSYGWHHDKNEQLEAEPPHFAIEKFRELAKHARVVAIGECGLDYYRLPSLTGAERMKDLQAEVFLKQAELANELGKPLMIHCRPSKGTDDAYEDLLRIMSTTESQMPKVVHFYVGSPVITEKLLAAGFYFTFGGVLTFAREYDEAIRMIPLDRILTETDAPYVAPEPYRGKRNEPAYVVEVATKLAELKRRSFEEVKRVTYETAQKVFLLP